MLEGLAASTGGKDTDVSGLSPSRLNNYTAPDPLDNVCIALKRTYACTDISGINYAQKKNQEYEGEDVEAVVDSMQHKPVAVRENFSLLELKLQELCRRIKEDTMKKHKNIKVDLSKRLRKRSLSDEIGSSRYHSRNEGLCQTLEYIVATMFDLEAMMTDIISTIEEDPDTDRMAEKDPVTSKKESETRNLPHNPKSLLSVLEEVRKTLVEFNSEYHQDSNLAEEVSKQTDKVKEKMSSLLNQWEVSQEQESSLHKMLGDFRNETNSISISVVECCFSAEAVQQVLKKSTSSIAEEIHCMEDSTYKEVKSWRQKVEDLRHQLHQERFRCCTMESEIRLLKDEIMRLQRYLFQQQSCESFKKSVEDTFRRICDICDRVQELSQGTSLPLQDKKSSFTVSSMHRARHSEEPTAEFSCDESAHRK